MTQVADLSVITLRADRWPETMGGGLAVLLSHELASVADVDLEELRRGALADSLKPVVTSIVVGATISTTSCLRPL